MTEPGVNKDRIDSRQVTEVESAPDSISVALDIAEVVRKIEIAAEYIGDETSSEARALGRRALDQVTHELKELQETAGTSLLQSSVYEDEVQPISREEQEKINEDILLFDLLDQVKDGVHDGVFAVDSSGEITLASKAVELITGYDSEELKGMVFQELVQPEDTGRLIQQIAETANGNHQPMEVRIIHKDGKTRWIRLSAYASSSAEEIDPQKFTGLIQDITETVNLRSFDGLTGVHSRHYFEVEMDKLRVSRTDNLSFPVSFIYTDLDKFKEYNDKFGHTRGDELLIEFGMLLMENSRPEDCVARMGGDEFVILLQKTTARVAKRKAKLLEEKLNIRNQNKFPGALPLNASFGTATATSSETLDESRDVADLKMYSAKRKKQSSEAKVE